MSLDSERDGASGIRSLVLNLLGIREMICRPRGRGYSISAKRSEGLVWRLG